MMVSVLEGVDVCVACVCACHQCVLKSYFRPVILVMCVASYACHSHMCTHFLLSLFHTAIPFQAREHVLDG
jgi:hypothetical protein